MTTATATVDLALAEANEAAARMNQDWLGCEHLLIGLVRLADVLPEECQAALQAAGATADRLDEEAIKLLIRGPEDMVVLGRRPRTPRLIGVLDRASHYAGIAGRNETSGADLLRALLDDQQSMAFQLLLNIDRRLIASLQVELLRFSDGQ